MWNEGCTTFDPPTFDPLCREAHPDPNPNPNPRKIFLTWGSNVGGSNVRYPKWVISRWISLACTTKWQPKHSFSFLSILTHITNFKYQLLPPHPFTCPILTQVMKMKCILSLLTFRVFYTFRGQYMQSVIEKFTAMVTLRIAPFKVINFSNF